MGHGDLAFTARTHLRWVSRDTPDAEKLTSEKWGAETKTWSYPRIRDMTLLRVSGDMKSPLCLRIELAAPFEGQFSNISR
jgi:hypothetical protein